LYLFRQSGGFACLKLINVNSKLVLQCWKLLQELSVLNTVLLFWVPGHRGIPGNEAADTLAGTGSKQSTCGLEPYLPVSRAVTKLKINNWLTNTLSNGWKLSSGCRQSKLWIVEPSKNLAKSLIKLPRHKLSILVGLITGHSRLNEHLFRMALVSEPLCQSCRLENESAFHFTCICPARSLLRAQIFCKPVLNLEDYKRSSATNILQFAIKSGRFETQLVT
jgi:RNase H